MEIPKPNPGWLKRQAAARAYQPKKVRLLLLGESPPSDERGFYIEGEASAEPLFAGVGAVLFEQPPSGSKTPFLKELRRRGIFVMDLKPDAPRHGEPLGDYVAPLIINLSTLSPEHVILVTPDVYEAAHAKLEKAGLAVVDVRVPAPGHETEFRQKLRQALVRADLEKLIRPLPGPRKPPPAA